ncbi:MAG: 23S rRNA (adenine(2503)-C(2))-methyltransferase RlmN [Bacilli bacterium]|nr:23S rRNA (adenine(2503)-C(2))-methyltransferase RlmN [Bacilli bacterium]MBQ6282128.1 23S rRNA (adenine(2503)-C(2))-methyltransferase RlmN [Bacilli bacterium]
MNSIYSYTRDDFINYFLDIGEKKFKADILYDWLYKKRVTDIDSMNNLNKNVISKLKEDMFIDNIKIIKKDVGSDVVKYLFELSDNEKIEAVVMYHDYGTSLCISTEVGCNMSCAFCESGRLKKRRNLLVNEMVLQILEIEKDINKRISHVVLMGIGEPFDNYENVIKFVNIINDSKGIDIGARHITISTCGIVPKIYEFASLKTQVNLAVSLHAPNNELRNKLMPINKVYSLNELMKAIKEYINITNRRVTFEYIMLDGINDTEECAYELSNLLKGMNCYVNLIPYNETNNIGFKRSKSVKIDKFYDILKKNNISVTIRREFGGLVSAACGQLRSHE